MDEQLPGPHAEECAIRADLKTRGEKCRSYIEMVKFRDEKAVEDVEEKKFIDALPDRQDQETPYDQLSYSCGDAFFALYAIFTLLADMVTDISVAYMFWLHGKHEYFIAMVVFIGVPAVMLTGTGLRWYVVDMENPRVPPASMTRWAVRVVFLLLQIGPVLRYVDSLRLGMLFRKQRKKHGCELTLKDVTKEGVVHECAITYRLMLQEDSDATFLRLFEAYLETGPQLMLQAYILLHAVYNDDVDENLAKVQLVSIFSSLLSLAWAPVSYYRTVRLSSAGKATMNCSSTIVSVLWQLCFLSSRCLALSLFAAKFNEWVFVPLSVHIVVMIIWAKFMDTDLCKTKWEEALLILMLSLAYTFSFFNPKEERTRYKHMFFYVVCFLEDSILMMIWLFHEDSEHKLSYSFKYGPFAGVYVSFAMSLLFMYCYYSWCHPTGNIRPLIGKGCRKHVSDNAVRPNEQKRGTCVEEIAMDKAGAFSV